MKYILKGNEPRSLTTYRSTPNASFEGCNKATIRLSLIEEQGAICAYCMQRISNKRNSKLSKPCTEIEHYKSQDVFNGTNGKPDLRLNYNNMLGVCNGNAGFPIHKQHCDKSKDFKKNKVYLPLTIDPLHPNCEKLIHFKGNGKIFSKNEVIHRDIDLVLNLNESSLVNNRKIAIDMAILAIKSKQKRRQKSNQTESDGWRIAAINQELAKWKQLNKKGYNPFCQAVIYYLEKKLKQYN